MGLSQDSWFRHAEVETDAVERIVLRRWGVFGLSRLWHCFLSSSACVPWIGVLNLSLCGVLIFLRFKMIASSSLLDLEPLSSASSQRQSSSETILLCPIIPR